jgi:thiol-disulfide isomerase/thioredoxin
MKNWIIVFLIFAVPLGLYGWLDNRMSANAEVTAQNLAALDKGAKTGTARPMPVIYKFSSPLCGDCQKVAKKFEPLKSKYGNDVTFKEYNVSGSEGSSEAVSDMIEKYKITVVPTILYVDSSGKLVKKLQGDVSQNELELNIEKLIEAK